MRSTFPPQAESSPKIQSMMAETMAKIDAMFAPRRELEARCMEGLIASGRFTFIDENHVYKFEGDET